MAKTKKGGLKSFNSLDDFKGMFVSATVMETNMVQVSGEVTGVDNGNLIVRYERHGSVFHSIICPANCTTIDQKQRLPKDDVEEEEVKKGKPAKKDEKHKAKKAAKNEQEDDEDDEDD
jgi:hypothetical protein